MVTGIWCQVRSALRSASSALRMAVLPPPTAAPWLQARLVFEATQLKAFVLASRPERLVALQADASNAVELTQEACLQVTPCASNLSCRGNQRTPLYCPHLPLLQTPTPISRGKSGSAVM